VNGAAETRSGEAASLRTPGVDGRAPIGPGSGERAVIGELRARFPGIELAEQETADGIPTLWLDAARLGEVLGYLKRDAPQPYRVLWDVAGVDERLRRHREGLPPADFTVVYHLLSYERSAFVRLKVPLRGAEPSIPTITGLWPAADWYEREVWDMFGIGIEGHPRLRRILMPPWWEGHPLRKEHPSRGTELGPFVMPPERAAELQDMLGFRAEEWGLEDLADDPDVMFLNVGPQHGGTHGVVHITVGLRSEQIVACIVDIGYHHRAKEKMAERQSWHTFIPYTDRVDYLGGVQNNMNYLTSVERLAGIEVPDRAKLIRIMLCELYRINSHLLYYGTYAQDIGALSPVFYMFADRELIHDITMAICGGRMHPNWFRIGGVAEDLPEGWRQMIEDFLDYLPPRLDEYDGLVVDSRITRARTRSVGAISLDEAIEWGVTGPNLRACGLPWDFRRARPYGGYDQLEFDIPIAHGGDSYDRLLVRVEEMRQSLRIIRQCVDNMPEGPYKAAHPLTTPPIKEPGTMHHIETLINHFLGVSWGPVMPVGEAMVPAESFRGGAGYYLTSDGDVTSYRTRIRTPSFPHLQVLPLMIEGQTVPDLIALLGSIDFVMSDVDR
jgi:NADH-quinone oxidoreductase subunit C/D